MPLDCCIYLVEDDDTVARSLAVLLQLHRYQVLRFGSAVQFLESLDGLPPGCILMDYSLPGLNGLAAVRELTRRGYRWPVLLMTGYDVAPLAEEAGQLQICSIVEKPFAVETMIAELERLQPSRRRTGATAPVDASY